MAPQAEVWPFVALAALGAWTIILPYLGRAIGLVVDVASKVEIVDHVIPGVLVATIGSYLAINAHRKAPPGLSRTIGGAICFLAGFWIFATHVPLVADAADGRAAWGATVWHASTALPIVGLSLWILLRDS